MDYYKENSLKLDSWFKVALKDYQELVNNDQFKNIINSFGSEQVKLLDIGCGTGMFPHLLDKKIDSKIQFSSDLFDVSDYCLKKCHSVFDESKHFQNNETFLSSIENIEITIPKSSYYDVIWGIHSFYTVDINKIKNVMEHICRLLKNDGTFLIYHASSKSCYHQLYDFLS
eukprot:UN28880